MAESGEINSCIKLPRQREPLTDLMTDLAVANNNRRQSHFESVLKAGWMIAGS